MQKHFFSLLIAACGFFSANAQITIDGIVTDWNTVPVLSEPGIFPFAKVASDGTNVYFLVTLDDAHVFDPSAWFTVDLYIDADFSAATGMKQWVYTASGIDYLVQGPDLRKFTGPDGSGDWAWDGIGSGARGYSTDARSAELSLAIADFTDTALGETWGAALPYYYSGHEGGDPVFFPEVQWDFADRKVFVVKARSEISLNNMAELVPSNAFYFPFMKDENIAEYLDFQSTDWAAKNLLHWASWAVDLSSPTTFNLKMTSKNSGSGKFELALVDRTSNQIVKTFFTGDDAKWYPENADFTEDDYGVLDMSDVPAGKYMLKLTNPTDWGTFLKVAKLTLTNLNPTAIKPADALENVTLKVHENGFLIASENAADVYVYSAEGKMISNYKQVKSIDKQLHQGFYLINIQSNGEQITQKICIK
jgi:hypothetical protein